MILDYAYGILNLDFWGYAVAAFGMVQLSMMSVTLYLHRDQAHRSLDLHPALRHLFRLWIWLTSGMQTRQWVAVHRKHHALCEREGDPHSPVIFGLSKVLLEGAELYRVAASDEQVLDKYGRGSPNDWVERNVYRRFGNLGITLLVLADLVLFGAPGIIIVAVQLSAMPVFAAGVINGLGHARGYRNFECDDASTNLVPWGLLIGGEELHNNHHAFPTSAKFSVQPWEFDIGWMYIRIFRALGLARVKKVAPAPVLVAPAHHVDLDTVRAVIVNRMHVLRAYGRQVTIPLVRRELADQGARMVRTARRLLVRQPAMLDPAAREQLSEILEISPELKQVHELRERLRMLWDGRVSSNEKLLADFRNWLREAEESGISVLQDFAETLRGYALSARA